MITIINHSFLNEITDLEHDLVFLKSSLKSMHRKMDHELEFETIDRQTAEILSDSITSIEFKITEVTEKLRHKIYVLSN